MTKLKSIFKLVCQLRTIIILLIPTDYLPKHTEEFHIVFIFDFISFYQHLWGVKTNLYLKKIKGNTMTLFIIVIKS